MEEAAEGAGVIAALEREARRDMDTDEVRFSVEAPLLDHLYLWSDKYRPRKPRYFNRFVYAKSFTHSLLYTTWYFNLHIICFQSTYRFRMEQIQSDALRYG